MTRRSKKSRRSAVGTKALATPPAPMTRIRITVSLSEPHAACTSTRSDRCRHTLRACACTYIGSDAPGRGSGDGERRTQLVPDRRKALSIAILAAVLAIPIVAGPVAAKDVQHYNVDFPPVGFTWSFDCGGVEVDGTIIANSEKGTDFFDDNGNWYKSIIAG